MKALLREKRNLLGLFLLVLILAANIISFLNNCLSSYDLGLYYQALVNMAEGELNPYLTIRTLNIFNDHFEPALFLAVPSVVLSGFSPVGPIVFEWAIYVLFIYLLVRLKNYENAGSILFLCLFSRGILTALNFPIHPNTWSIISWLFLVYFIYKDNFKWILISAFSLILFRESNVFALVGLFLFYCTSLNKKKIISSMALCLLGLFIVFKLRPLMVGETYDYGGVFIKGLLDRHFFFLLERILLIDLKSFLKVFFPILLPVFWAYKAEGKTFIRSSLFQILCILAPLLFLHILAGKIHYHYGITFIAPLLCYFIFSSGFSNTIENKKIKIYIALTFFLTSTSTYTKWFKQSFFNQSKNCFIDSKRRAATSEVRVVLDKSMTKESTIFSTNRVVPNIVKAGRRIYVPSHFTNHLENYDFILLEKRPPPLYNSLSGERYNKAMEVCESAKTKTLIDNEYFLLIEGKFGRQCFNQFLSI